jgi:hypothetical protein
MYARLAAMAWLIPVIVACGSNGPHGELVDEAGAVTAVVRWAADHEFTTAPDGPRPVVYVVSEDGSSIAATVQAEVARTTVDDIDVRFADKRDEALELDVENEPVKDGGRLLLLGPMPAKGSTTVGLAVDLYRTNHDIEPLVFSLRATTSGVTVVSVQPRSSP